MHLMKWFRKNNTKIMAVVVVVLMIGFVGGSYLSRIGSGNRGINKTVASFADGKEITNKDLAAAQQELEILKKLRVDYMLRSMGVPMLRNTPNMQAALLAEVLFAEHKTSSQFSNFIKQTVRKSGYSISEKQINDIYRGTMSNAMYWLLLTEEARQAGIRLPDENAGKILADKIPGLFNSATYQQLISVLVKQNGISEEKMLSTFGKLIAVLKYSEVMCSSEDVTTEQIRHTFKSQSETMNVEIVRFDSAVFVKDRSEPSKQQISEQFEKYKSFFPADVSKDNPYGFGYKLPDMVQIEYIAIKLDDVAAIVSEVTQQGQEEYYQRNREQLTEVVPSDPNDPNSPTIEQIKNYADVADEIGQKLLTSRINSKAESILRQAKEIIEANFDSEDANNQNIDSYQKAADELSGKYNMDVYAGKTGLLNAIDLEQDEYFSRLYLTGSGYNPAKLSRIVFAVESLDASELGPFDVPKPKMYENIGTVKDLLGQTQKDTAGQIMLICRVIKTRPAGEPDSAEMTFDNGGLKFEKQAKENAKVYSVKEKVAEDLKKLEAMDVAKTKAEEFVKLAKDKGFDKAIEKFNKLYSKDDTADGNDPNTFELRELGSLRRISDAAMQTLIVQNLGNPAADFMIGQSKNEAVLIEKLYGLVPNDSNSIDTLPVVMEFKPDMSYYCVKDIEINRTDRGQYNQVKLLQAYQEDVVQSQTLAVVHFLPDNILQRMNFQLANKSQENADANVPGQDE